MTLDRSPTQALWMCLLILPWIPSGLSAAEPGEPRVQSEGERVEIDHSPVDSLDVAAHAFVDPTDMEVQTVADPSSFEAEDAVEPITAGMWIFFDPETGERRATPTPEQAERIRSWAASLTKSDKGLASFELQEGGRGVFLRGRYRHALMAFIDDQGQLGYTCSDQAASSEGSGHSHETTEPAPER